MCIRHSKQGLICKKKFFTRCICCKNLPFYRLYFKVLILIFCIPGIVATKIICKGSDIQVYSFVYSNAGSLGALRPVSKVNSSVSIISIISCIKGMSYTFYSKACIAGKAHISYSNIEGIIIFPRETRNCKLICICSSPQTWIFCIRTTHKRSRPGYNIAAACRNCKGRIFIKLLICRIKIEFCKTAVCFPALYCRCNCYNRIFSPAHLSFVCRKRKDIIKCSVEISAAGKRRKYSIIINFVKCSICSCKCKLGFCCCKIYSCIITYRGKNYRTNTFFERLSKINKSLSCGSRRTKARAKLYIIIRT